MAFGIDIDSFYSSFHSPIRSGEILRASKINLQISTYMRVECCQTALAGNDESTEIGAEAIWQISNIHNNDVVLFVEIPLWFIEYVMSID